MCRGIIAFFRKAFTKPTIPPYEVGDDLDAYLNADDDTVRYLLEKGRGCVADLEKSNIKNEDKINRLLNYLIIGMGALVMFLFSKYGVLPKAILMCGVGLVMWWALICAYLIYFVLFGHEKITANNSPDILYSREVREYPWSVPDKKALQCNELVNLTWVIESLAAINSRLTIYFIMTATSAITGTAAITLLAFLYY